MAAHRCLKGGVRQHLACGMYLADVGAGAGLVVRVVGAWLCLAQVPLPLTLSLHSVHREQILEISQVLHIRFLIPALNI